MKIVKLEIDKDGKSRVEAQGFQGEECRKATDALIAAMGETISDEPTAEGALVSRTGERATVAR